MLTNVKTTIVIVTLFFSSILLVGLITIFTKYANDHENGFVRSFLQDEFLISDDTLILENNAFYMAGNTNHSLYLGSFTGPRSILHIKINNLDSLSIIFQIPHRNKFILSSIRVAVDSPYFYMGDGTVPIIYKGILSECIGNPIHNSDKHYFIAFTPFQGSSFVINALSSSNERRLGTMNSNGNISFHSSLLKRQIDGFFCTEGMLHVDSTTFTYVYSYRNEFFTTDHDLNPILRGKTIDTITHAQIKVSDLSSSNTRVLSSPPRLVNRRSTVWKNSLFINSNLLADNESKKRFQSSAVIDVYNLKSMDYRFSFYIPNYAGKNLNSFILTDRKLLVLYETTLLSFNISEAFYKRHFACKIRRKDRTPVKNSRSSHIN